MFKAFPSYSRKRKGNFSWGQFHQTFLPSEKLSAHGVWRKIQCSISPKKLKAKIKRSKFAKSVCHSPNAVCQKRRQILQAKNSGKMLMRSTPELIERSHMLQWIKCNRSGSFVEAIIQKIFSFLPNTKGGLRKCLQTSKFLSKL